MKFAIGAILFIASSLSWSATASYPQISVKVTPIKVSSNAYYVLGQPGIASNVNQGFNSNAGFVLTKDGVVVIDALGTPALGNAFLKAIKKITSLPIKRVIVTHYHADHFYGLQAFKDAGAEIWAHRTGRDYLESDEANNRLAQRSLDLFPWVDEKTKLIPADRWLDKDESFTLGGTRFEIVHLGPAHAPDDVVIVVHGDQIVFSGDILYTGRIPFVGEADSKRWLQTFSRLENLKPKLMVPGHGKVSRDPTQDFKLTRDYLTYLRAEMGKAVEGFISFDEAYAKTDWSRFANLPAFAEGNRINAYGTYLLMEKESLAGRQ